MKAVAVGLTFGRVELAELLTQWARQSMPCPLFLYFNGIPLPIEYLPPGVVLEQCAPALSESSDLAPLGSMMSAAVARARALFELTPDDAVLVIDDDDYYSPHHVEATTAALQRAEWTGAQRIGIQWRPRQMPPEIIQAGWGPGQHAAWGYRLRTYDRAGGYFGGESTRSDVSLGQRMGWALCSSHRRLTHVRRQFGYASISSPQIGFSRERLRASTPRLARIQPAQWSADLDALERWTLAHEIG